MKKLKLEEVLKEIKGEILCGETNKEIESVSIDTRTIKKGETYFALKGEKADGSIYCKQAIENGATICFVQKNIFTPEELKEIGKKATIIIVENTENTLVELAKIKRKQYQIPVIAITGSVGKTSTKDVIAEVMAQKYKVHKTQGNQNNRIGVPLTIMSLKDHQALVIEMGMNHQGEISELTQIAKPTICVISNIGTSHIGNLGSRENILKAKLEILEGNPKAKVIINNDNDLLHKWYKGNKEKYNITTYGIKNQSNFNAQNIILDQNGSEFICNINKKDEKIRVPVGGEHFVLNSLCAIAVGNCLSVKTTDIIEGIEGFELTKKRMDIKELKNGVKIINDAYNASFESMKATLNYLSKFNENRKIAVLGDMFELGDFSKELHEKVGNEVVKNNIDILICNGENSKYIISKAEEKGMKEENIYYFENREEILELLEKIAKKGDVILFKASNGMKFFELANRIESEEFWTNKIK